MAKITNTKNEHTYFHSLELEGIGCFKEKQFLDLSDGNGSYSNWTLILGDNGTGKTTLLRVLDRMQPVEFSFNGIDIFYFPIYFKSSQLFYFNIEYSKLQVVNNSEIDSIIIENHGWGEFKIEFKNVFLLSYGASRRMSKDVNLSSLISEQFYTSLFDDSIELINAEEWYLQKCLKLNSSEGELNAKIKSQLTIIENILINFLPDVKKINLKQIKSLNESSSIEVQTENGEWIPLRDLSYGYQTMTALLVDIGSRMMDKYPESDNPLAEPVIILIDEIDLHLHPKWQRQIMEQFSKYFPKAQFIVTSHSPLIVQAAEAVNANIVVCRKDGDKVIIDNNPEEVKGWRIDQILISDLFDLPTVRSNADEEKMSRYYELEAKSERTIQEESELEDIQKDIKKSFESDKPFSETERKINQFLETHLK